MEVKETEKTYAEHLREVRAKQFGYVVEEVSKITEGTYVKVKEDE